MTRCGRGAGLGSLLLIVLWSSPAASSAGSAFGGPARATGGASAFNPAALAAAPPGWGVLLDLAGAALLLEYQRAGDDPRTGDPHPAVTSRELAPNPLFTLVGPTPWPGFRLFLGGFSPSTVSTKWPEDGPNRYHGTNQAMITYALPAGVVFAAGERLGLALGAGPTFGYLVARYALDFGAYANGQLPPGAQLLPLEDPQLTGRVTAHGTGWTTTFVAGLWGRPLPWLRLGAGLFWPLDVTLRGTVRLQGSDALAEALPGFQLDTRGDLTTRYPLYPQLQAEVEAQLGRLRLALLWQHIFCGSGERVRVTVADASLAFINGPQPSVGDMRADWLLGLRLSRKLAGGWEIGGRVDVDPNSVPYEVLSPANLDFTTVQLTLGARRRLGDQSSLALSYTLVVGLPAEVTQSLYDPYAPPESGLAMPSGNGRYGVGAHLLTLQYAGFWGGRD